MIIKPVVALYNKHQKREKNEATTVFTPIFPFVRCVSLLFCVFTGVGRWCFRRGKGQKLKKKEKKKI